MPADHGLGLDDNHRLKQAAKHLHQRHDKESCGVICVMGLLLLLKKEGKLPAQDQILGFKSSFSSTATRVEDHRVPNQSHGGSE
jgi:hypothetical protein